MKKLYCKHVFVILMIISLAFTQLKNDFETKSAKVEVIQESREQKLNAYVSQFPELYLVKRYFNESEKWNLLDQNDTVYNADLIWFLGFKREDLVAKEHQMINNWPSQHLLYNKRKLKEMIYSYQNETNNKLKIIPKSFYVDLKSTEISDEEQQLIDMRNLESKPIWIVKPVDGRLGEDIFLTKDLKEVFGKKIKLILEKNNMTNTKHYKEIIEYVKKYPNVNKNEYLVQEYIENALLLEKKKFDMRGYLLIACFDPLLVVYINGYIKKSVSNYDAKDTTNLAIHLTNNSFQKKLKEYQTEGNNTLWGMKRFQDYLRNELMFTYYQIDEMFEKLYEKLAVISDVVRTSTRVSSTNKQRNSFVLYGPDIAFDADLESYILELNLYPMIHYNQPEIQPQLKKMIKYFMELEADIIKNKKNLREYLSKLEQKDLPEELIIIYNEAKGFKYSQQKHFDKIKRVDVAGSNNKLFNENILKKVVFNQKEKIQQTKKEQQANIINKENIVVNSDL